MRLGAAAGLLSCLSHREHDTAMLEAASAAGSLCGGVTSDIPSSQRDETNLFLPLGPWLSPDDPACKYSCAPFVLRASLLPPS